MILSWTWLWYVFAFCILFTFPIAVGATKKELHRLFASAMFLYVMTEFTWHLISLSYK